MVRRLGLGKNNHLTYASLALNPRYVVYLWMIWLPMYEKQWLGYLPSTHDTLITPCSDICLFVCVAVLRPRQPNGVMSSAVSLPNHTFIGQAKSSKQLTSIMHILLPETDNCPCSNMNSVKLVPHLPVLNTTIQMQNDNVNNTLWNIGHGYKIIPVFEFLLGGSVCQVWWL